MSWEKEYPSQALCSLVLRGSDSDVRAGCRVNVPHSESSIVHTLPLLVNWKGSLRGRTRKARNCTLYPTEAMMVSGDTNVVPSDIWRPGGPHDDTNLQGLEIGVYARLLLLLPIPLLLFLPQTIHCCLNLQVLHSSLTTLGLLQPAVHVVPVIPLQPITLEARRSSVYVVPRRLFVLQLRFIASQFR
jgi:hypothetical protein